jgi:hypothetical protein
LRGDFERKSPIARVKHVFDFDPLDGRSVLVLRPRQAGAIKKCSGHGD